ncbi:MAG TPA: Lrp/AsnC family transcriptional regulator [Syntrophaceae bacterium]|nr:Lrp/AsnC family transcriptional regulator [Syntrophaceae bacterium]
MLTKLKKRIIHELQGDLSIKERPFLEIAHRIGISEDQLLSHIQKLIDDGYIRRFGATLQHQIAGFEANAMVAWLVDEKDIKKVGKIMSSFPEVTHCYQRQTSKGWKYNLFTMIHGRTEQECYAIAKKISERTGIKEYHILFSLEELKKTTMRYF